MSTTTNNQYNEWLKTVLMPIERAVEYHAHKMSTLGLSSSSDDQAAPTSDDHAVQTTTGESSNQLVDARETAAQRLLQQLSTLRTFARSHCDATLEERDAFSNDKRKDRNQFAQQLAAIRDFLARDGRAQRYGIFINELDMSTTFQDKPALQSLCQRLRRGVERETEFALRAYLEQWVSKVPIGGREQRSYDIGPILYFALDRNLTLASADEIYRLYVEHRLRDADSADESEEIDDLLESQFEMLATNRSASRSGSSRSSSPELSESAIGLAILLDKRRLSENAHLCESTCANVPGYRKPICITKPYSYYGQKYDWDYCEQ